MRQLCFFWAKCWILQRISCATHPLKELQHKQATWSSRALYSLKGHAKYYGIRLAMTASFHCLTSLRKTYSSPQQSATLHTRSNSSRHHRHHQVSPTRNMSCTEQANFMIKRRVTSTAYIAENNSKVQLFIKCHMGNR